MRPRQQLFITILISFSFFGFAWFDTVHAHAYTDSLNHFIQTHLSVSAYHNGTYEQALHVITFLGKEIVLGIALAILMIVLMLKKEYKGMVYCLIAFLLVMAMTALLKHIVYSPRPIPYSANLDSFPSGHTVRVTLWVGLYLMMDKLKYFTVPIIARWALVITALAVGYSRLGLDRHWFSDVLAAYSLTLGLLLILFYFYSQGRHK
jgi:membrane-associated phospholipid phosphatase